MKIDALVYEIGSTTTVVSAFHGLDTSTPQFLGQASAPTSVLEGDVTIGIHLALRALEQQMNHPIEAKETFATSSAAGGLKMSVHGLVYDMTVKAAKEAALGAGGNIRFVTAGKLTEMDRKKLSSMPLNMIMIAGGVDYGESQTALDNAKIIASMKRNIPVLYAGNIVNQDAVAEIFLEEGQSSYLTLCENVYPQIDQLRVEQPRAMIQKLFEEHIIHAPGMESLRSEIHGAILPTPGAVMEGLKLLYEDEDIMAIDVGGATTDIHSVAKGNDAVQRILMSPEPQEKRTVEGDLGVYINKDVLIEMIGPSHLMEELQLSKEAWNQLLLDYKPIPSPSQIPLVSLLTKEAVRVALSRHVGHYKPLYTTSGRTMRAEGKDLTAVRKVYLTGGALVRIPGGDRLVENALVSLGSDLLLPSSKVEIMMDHDYIMAACGVLSKQHPQAAKQLLLQSMRKE